MSRRKRVLAVVLALAVVLSVLGCDGLILASWEGGVNPAYATPDARQVRDGERMERLQEALRGGGK